MLLWEECAQGNPLAYEYTSICIKYREFAKTQLRSMRQVHLAGEKLFVDYAGATFPIVEAADGEISQAQIFVATLAGSNYTFACARPRQTTEDWVVAQVLALKFIGGAPTAVSPGAVAPPSAAYQAVAGLARNTAEQLPQIDRWATVLSYTCQARDSSARRHCRHRPDNSRASVQPWLKRPRRSAPCNSSLLRTPSIL